MIHRLLITILLAAIPMLATPSRAQTPSSDVAVGVFPFLVGNMDSRVNEIATNCQSHGIDTLYVSVFRTTGANTGDLWITDSAGSWNSSWGPVRPGGAGINLPSLIAACHAVNVRVVAVFKCFADTVQPDNAAHRQYLLDVVDYFMDAYQPSGQPVYDLDGFALDYVRYVGSSNANPTNVTNFVRDVRQHIGGLSLHAYLIANRYTFDGPTYNGSFASYSSVISGLSSQFGQHWEQLAVYLDVLMPMTYTADGSIYSTYALHQAYCRQAAAYARTACQLAGHPTRRVCNVVRTYTGSGETTTTSTIDASITGSLLGGADGYQSFRYQFLVGNPSWWTPMSAWAVPGCNWPKPVLSLGASRLTLAANPTLSTDVDEPSTMLQARFDYDGDGTFDTAWLANAGTSALARHPGPWTAMLQIKDSQGHVGATRRRFTAGTALAVFPGSVSTGNGGAVNVTLDVGTAGAGDVYLALGSLSGTSPGFEFAPGFPVPLNYDFLTGALATAPNSAFLNGGLGTFDGNGRATATLLLPAGVATPFAGQTVHWSFVAITPFGAPACVGDSKPMLLLP
ncbi:MAG: hypothetical protein KDE27_16835 [Planctomycetes bacterium]|nr:hypothetical protein [Planctomycetota bacterium]